MTAREQIERDITFILDSTVDLRPQDYDHPLAVGRLGDLVLAYGEKCQRDAFERAAKKAATITVAMNGEQVQERRELMLAIRAIAPREVEP